MSKKTACISDSTPVRKNFISVANSSSKKIPTVSSANTGHLVLKPAKNSINHLMQDRNEINSLPHTPTKEKIHLTNSQSYENKLADLKDDSTDAKKSVEHPNSASPKVSTPKLKSNTPSNFQKYHSFQKPSYIAFDKCSCFNMPFICEICTNK